MNKLVDDKRYDDALKVFEFASQRGFSSSGRAYPTDIVMLAIEALYRQVSKDEAEVKPKRHCLYLNLEYERSIGQGETVAVQSHRARLGDQSAYSVDGCSAGHSTGNRAPCEREKTTSIDSFQNEPSFAMEILGAIRTQNVATIQNLRVRIRRRILRSHSSISCSRRSATLKWIESKRRSTLFICSLINLPCTMIVVESFL